MILVTGGTGFLGRHLVPTLCKAGHEVRVLARHPEAHPWLRRYALVSAIQGDVLDTPTLEKAMEGCRYVVHAAGFFRFWGADEIFERTNVGGTQNALNAAVHAQVKRFIYVSTIAVVGQPLPDRIVDEEHPAHPMDAYQRSKLRAEALALGAQDANVVVLRPGAFYGPLGHYAFNRLFFRDPMRGIIMQVDGGRYVIFPAFVPDVAQSILLALNNGRAGEIYNICGESLSHKEAFDIVCEEARLWYPRIPLPGWLGIGISRFLTALSTLTQCEPFYPINLRSYVYNYWHVSADKARRELGFAPTDFREGARRTIAWYRAGQPDCLPDTDC